MCALVLLCVVCACVIFILFLFCLFVGVAVWFCVMGNGGEFLKVMLILFSLGVVLDLDLRLLHPFFLVKSEAHAMLRLKSAGVAPTLDDAFVFLSPSGDVFGSPSVIGITEVWVEFAREILHGAGLRHHVRPHRVRSDNGVPGNLTTTASAPAHASVVEICGFDQHVTNLPELLIGVFGNLEQ